MDDVLWLEGWENLRYPLRHLDSALLFVRGHHESIDVDHRQLFWFPVGFVQESSEDIQEFDGIHRQIHIDVLEPAKSLVQRLNILVVEPFSDDLPCTRIKAKHPMVDLIEFGILDKIQVAIWIEIVGNNVQTLTGCPHRQWSNTTEQIE